MNEVFYFAGALASGNDKFLFTAGSVWSSCMVLCDISITLTSACT
jgi:hypothetical protein